jgi:hypothetical protein
MDRNAKVIEGTYRTVGETLTPYRPSREPIIASRRGLFYLLLFVAIRALWLLITHHRS